MTAPSSIGAMKIREVAAELRVSDWSVRKLIADRELTAVRIGKARYIVLRADFEAYLQRARGVSA
jgi:excisionase family DNA binding protein